MITFKKLWQLNEMITQPVVYYVVLIWTIIIRETEIYLSKLQVVDVDPKAIQQINFIGNLNEVGNTTLFFIIKEAEETILFFSQRTVGELWIYFDLT